MGCLQCNSNAAGYRITALASGVFVPCTGVGRWKFVDVVVVLVVVTCTQEHDGLCVFRVFSWLCLLVVTYNALVNLRALRVFICIYQFVRSPYCLLDTNVLGATSCRPR